VDSEQHLGCVASPRPRSSLYHYSSKFPRPAQIFHAPKLRFESTGQVDLTTKLTKSTKCRGGFETRPYLTPFVSFVPSWWNLRLYFFGCGSAALCPLWWVFLILLWLQLCRAKSPWWIFFTVNPKDPL